jgi:amino acid adenylation domain-containing protein
VTLFTVLLSALKVLLYRYTGQEDIIIGTPITERHTGALAAVTGCFINTLPLRTRFASGDTFRSVLKLANETTTEAFNHYYYPFDALLADLNPVTAANRSPLFDVMLVLHNKENDAPPSGETGGLAPFSPATVLSKFDLTFEFIKMATHLSLELEFKTSLFQRAFIVRMISHFETLVQSIAEDLNRPLYQYRIMPRQESDKMLGTWSGTKEEALEDTPLHVLFERQAGEKGDHVALVSEDIHLTYSELNRSANCLAQYLRQEAGVGQEQPVGVYLERSPWMMISILAILKAGAYYVPIDPAGPPYRQQYVLGDTGLQKVLVAGRVTDNSFLPQELQIPLAEQWSAISQRRAHNIASDRSATSPVYVLYTSGSTGNPKGVMLEEQAVVNRLRWMWNACHFNGADVILQKTPFTFDVSVWEILMPVCFGAKVVFGSPRLENSLQLLTETIERHKVTTLHFVPSMLTSFLECMDGGATAGVKSLARVIASGEELSVQVCKRYGQKIKAPLYNLYGPTEAAIDVTHYRVAGTEASIPIGRPIANVKLYIVDGHCNVLPEGVAGEIAIGGVAPARGYLNNPEATAARFVEAPFEPGHRLYLTGDMAKWNAEGQIEYLGRRDQQVKINGVRIETGEIENTLLKHDLIADAKVYVHEAADKTRHIVGYLVARRQEASPEDLNRFLAQYLPQSYLPALYVYLSQFPLTASNKVDRKALPDPDSFLRSREKVVEAPRNETEARLLTIWQDVMGAGIPISIYDRFLEIGGNSLKAIQVIFRLQREFDLRVELRALLEETIETLAQRIRLFDHTHTTADAAEERITITI